MLYPNEYGYYSCIMGIYYDYIIIQADWSQQKNSLFCYS